jgi:hypothetical protein
MNVAKCQWQLSNLTNGQLVLVGNQSLRNFMTVTESEQSEVAYRGVRMEAPGKSLKKLIAYLAVEGE